ncbi:ATP-binding protein [bacterium]|nr:ATP-binding protein [bacterium]
MKPRWLEPRLRSALANFPVVFVQGPRRAGKSTLSEKVAHSLRMRIVNLDEQAPREAAKADPDGFIRDLGPLVMVDEVQRAPGLFLAIKAAVDRDAVPGRFLLTGSTSAMLLPALAEALVGRMAILTLLPLSQGEMEGRMEGFLEAVCSVEDPKVKEGGPTRSELLARALAGGFPEPLAMDKAEVGGWFLSYMTTVIARQVAEARDIARQADLRRIVATLAARTCSTLDITGFSRETGIPRTSLNRYLLLLEGVQAVTRVPAWVPSRDSRAGKRPRYHLVDSGLLSSVLGVRGESITDAGEDAGKVLETFALQEIARQQTWSRGGLGLHHYRRDDVREVDIVLEDGRRRIVGIEVKSTAGPSSHDFRGLRDLAARAGKRFLRGILLCTTDQSWSFGDNLHALPLSALWRLGAKDVERG